MSIFTEKGTGHGGRKGGFRSFAKSFGTSFIGALADRQLLHPYCPFQPHFGKLAPFPVYKTNAVSDQYASARI
jgi:hypothetical protein